ncbi:isochorismatase family protein [Acetobacter fallax]|uniref:nicotinamidase n=1 Tax=Acetobacter fallax TaxID=1737473 RepID=A0ABX0KEL2_9PROT|nr:isochorismatase family protein [Acetobacter fallax]NHO33576.1 isochorismatase family protein [Acetobacter fallax]NHO37178.1 isochorismatase family protein [Acetobacter fallax]
MIIITAHDALLIVDVQNDFLPGGALAVPEGDEVIPVINQLTRLPFGVIVATQDWHPSDHISFEKQGGPWPRHCVAGTQGADLAALLDAEPVGVILRKGRSSEIDSYSAFSDNNGIAATGLAGLLAGAGVTRVFVAGLALDICVAATAIDAKKSGFDTLVVIDACRAVGDAEDAETAMRTAGVRLVTSDGLA